MRPFLCEPKRREKGEDGFLPGLCVRNSGLSTGSSIARTGALCSSKRTCRRQPATGATEPGEGGERIIETVIKMGGISSIVIIALIFFFLLRGLARLSRHSLRQLFGPTWYPIEEMFGMLPLLGFAASSQWAQWAIALPLGLTTRHPTWRNRAALAA